MNEMNMAACDWLVSHSAYARVVQDQEGIAAFLLGLPPGAGYDSANYRWFSERFTSFLYIDRIAVDARARRMGFGSSLYEDIAAFARGRWACLLAEVNQDPPNTMSDAFHERHGFERVGELRHAYEGAHARHVAMLRRGLE
jgi:predicted GNAT superfamily acetyltransferase